jgi:hypothetical protein
LPAGDRRRRPRDPRLPRGAGVPQGCRRTRRPAIEAGIGSILGRPVTVRCIVANIEVAAGPADAAYVLAEARRIFADDIVDVGEVT